MEYPYEIFRTFLGDHPLLLIWGWNGLHGKKRGFAVTKAYAHVLSGKTYSTAHTFLPYAICSFALCFQIS